MSHRLEACSGSHALLPVAFSGSGSQQEALVAGCSQATGNWIGSLLESQGLRTVTAPDYEETLGVLECKKFDLWILDSNGLNLSEPFVWASLRYVSDHAQRLETNEKLLKPGAVVPVMVLIDRGDPDALKAVNAAGQTPVLTSWNRQGWEIGVQELPCNKADFLALVRELLTSTAAVCAASD